MLIKEFFGDFWEEIFGTFPKRSADHFAAFWSWLNNNDNNNNNTKTNNNHPTDVNHTNSSSKLNSS